MSEKLVAKTKAAMEQQFDLNLIEAVRLNPVIYDRTHFNYKHNMRKAQHWKQISEELGVHEQKCIKRWKSLRDKFAREMKISSESRWRYFKKMSFLVEYIRQYRESLLGKCGPLPTTQTTTTTTTQVTQVESNQQQQQQHQQQQHQQQQHQQQQQTQPQSQQQQTQPQSQQQQTQRQPQPQTQQQQQQPQVQQQCLVDIFPFHGAATTSTQAVHHPHVTGDTQLTTVTTAPPKDQKSFCYEPPMKRKRFDDEQHLQLQQQQQLLLQQQQQLQQHNDSMLNTINKFQNSLSQGVCPEDQSFGVAVTDMLNTLGVKQKAEAKVHIVKYLTDMKFLAQHRKF